MVPIARVRAAAQQHDKNHGIQQVVLEGRGGGLDSIRLVNTEGADDHLQDVDPDQRGDGVEDLLLGGSLQDRQTACNKHQNGNVSQTVGNH